MYIFSNSKIETELLKDQIGKSFKMKDLGNLEECLGVRIEKNLKTRTIRLNQTKHVQKLLDRFGMSECKPVGTPLEMNARYEKSREQNANHPYQELIGGLMYLASRTRPDISHAVSYLSQFNTSHGDEHWNAAKRVLRYLRGTENYNLEYKRRKNELKGYAYADWVGCIMDRHSCTGCHKIRRWPDQLEVQETKNSRAKCN
jgi:hypothetical protein